MAQWYVDNPAFEAFNRFFLNFGIQEKVEMIIQS